MSLMPPGIKTESFRDINPLTLQQWLLSGECLVTMN